MKPYLHRSAIWLLLGLAFIATFLTAPSASAKDSGIKSWTTAELLGAMRWAKAESGEGKRRREFTAAETICHRRLDKQIDDGAISRG